MSELSMDSINTIFYKYPFHVRHLLQNDNHLAENSKSRGYVLFPPLITAEMGFLPSFPSFNVEPRGKCGNQDTDLQNSVGYYYYLQ